MLAANSLAVGAKACQYPAPIHCPANQLPYASEAVA
jgi:hypothetical protein